MQQLSNGRDCAASLLLAHVNRGIQTFHLSPILHSETISVFYCLLSMRVFPQTLPTPYIQNSNVSVSMLKKWV